VKTCESLSFTPWL